MMAAATAGGELIVAGNNSNSEKSRQGAHQFGGAICECSLILELLPVGLGLVSAAEVIPIATLINLLVNIKYPCGSPCRSKAAACGLIWDSRILWHLMIKQPLAIG